MWLLDVDSDGAAGLTSFVGSMMRVNNEQLAAVQVKFGYTGRVEELKRMRMKNRHPKPYPCILYSIQNLISYQRMNLHVPKPQKQNFAYFVNHWNIPLASSPPGFTRLLSELEW